MALTTSEMYKLRPIQNHFDIVVNSPMYKMKNLQECTQIPHSAENHIESNQSVQLPIKGEQDNSINNVTSVDNFQLRQDEILKQLKALKGQLSLLRLELAKKVPNSNNSKEFSEMSSDHSNFKATLNKNLVTHDIVLNANPEYPPYSLLAIGKLWNGLIQTRITSYVHSSIQSLPQHLEIFKNSKTSGFSTQAKIAVNIMLIWKKVDIDCELIISPVKQITIRGEVNLLKFFNRLASESLGIAENVLEATVLASVLDSCHQVLHVRSTQERSKLFTSLNSLVNKRKWLVGDHFTIADLALWSVLSKSSFPNNFPSLKEWFERTKKFVNLTI